MRLAAPKAFPPPSKNQLNYWKPIPQKNIKNKRLVYCLDEASGLSASDGQISCTHVNNDGKLRSAAGLGVQVAIF